MKKLRMLFSTLLLAGLCLLTGCVSDDELRAMSEDQIRANFPEPQANDMIGRKRSLPPLPYTAPAELDLPPNNFGAMPTQPSPTGGFSSAM